MNFSSILQKIRQFFFNYEYALVAWLIIGLLVAVGIYLGIDKHIIGAVVVLVGVLGQAFAALVAWIGFVPFVGPIIAKVLSLPFIWLLNGIGYLASLIAIKRGYSKDVVNYRVITVTLLVGITIGYVVGKVI
ncbi:MAG: hypothetical protein WBD36_08825 [Bacteroidota bacterium]